ncbi:tetratricopeptide repeat protein, partial [candidate division WOR-3 bacterium]|nr:tetratricopeptide repeat protein [candidate division WOR-3 bacterium]
MGKGEQRIVLLTKLEPPQSSLTTLRRSALISLLDKNRNKKAVLICAGAGYGKTTLVSQFLTKRNIRYMYYHLEKDDAEPATFLSYILAGLRSLDRGFGKKTESLSRFFNHFTRYQEIIIGTLLNDIVECFADDVYIVLEDYHSLTMSGRVDTILDYMLEHLPPRLHFIITSRTMPGLQLSKLRARDELLELSSQHLRFSFKEIEHFFRKAHAKPLKPKEIKWIEQHSEGWPTSLRLMLQSSEYLDGIRSSRYVREILDSYYQSQASLFNYFTQEIFNNEPERIQRFLIDCSLFEWLTPGFCDAITRERSCGNILSRLTRRNAFLFKIPHQGYRFHNLYQEFLRSKMTNVQRERALYHRAAAYFYHQNRFEEALKYYLKSEQYQKACRLVEKFGYDMIRLGRSSILNLFIESIPEALRNTTAGVLIMYAQTLVHVGRSEEAKNVLLRAIRLLKTTKGKRADLSDALYELGGICLNQDRYQEARRYFLRAAKLCPVHAGISHAAILNSLGFVHSALGGRNSIQAEHFFCQAYNIAHRKKYGELEASVLNNWALHEWKKGEIHPAYQKLIDMVKILTTHYSPHCGAGFYNAARLCLLLGKTSEAQRILDSGSQQSSQFNDQWSMATLWKGYGLLYGSMGNYGKAKQWITRSLKVYEDLGIVRLTITSLNELCRIHINLDELSDAEKNLSAIWWFKKDKEDSEAVPLLITKGQLQMAQGKYDEALKTLETAFDLASRFNQPLHTFYVHVELSRVFHARNMISRSIGNLQQAVNLSRLKGYEYMLRTIFEHNPWMVSLLEAEASEREYLSMVVAGSMIYKHCIEATLFGTPTFKINGKALTAGVWKTRNAEKLFCYLLLQKGKALASDSIIEIFWSG